MACKCLSYDVQVRILVKTQSMEIYPCGKTLAELLKKGELVVLLYHWDNKVIG